MSRTMRVLSAAAALAFISIVLLANVIFDSLLGGQLKWDWSSGHYYTIGAVTHEILNNLDKDIEIIGLFDSTDNISYGDIRVLLQAYEEQSGGKVTVRYIDPEKNPEIIGRLDPDGLLKPQLNTFIVYCPQTKKAKPVAYNDLFATTIDYTTNQETVTGVIAEQGFTSAIRFVKTESTPLVYFSAGHDEDTYEQSYSMLAAILKNNNYGVRILGLGATEVPADCTILVMLNPKKDLSSAESKVISAWLKKGGSLFVMSDYDTEGFATLNALLSDYQIAVTTDRIREENSLYRYQASDAYTLRAIAPLSPLTSQVVDGWTLIFKARRIEQLANPMPGIIIVPVLTTSAAGVSETNGKTDQSSQPGIQIIGLMAEDKRSMDGIGVTRSTRVMVIGSASFLEDEVFKAFGTQIYNAPFFYESISWLAGTDAHDALFIKPKDLPGFTITTGSTSTYSLTVLFVLILIPGLFLLLALRVHRQRRRSR